VSDQRLRELERAAATGDLEAAQRLLQERLRRRLLTEDNLRLAAYLGHEPALRLRPDVVTRREREDMLLWTCGLGARWGRVVLVRGLLALARRMTAAKGDLSLGQTALVRTWPTIAQLVLEPGRTYAVGRDPASALVLEEKAVSRRHFELEMIADRAVRVRDMGSRNGTYLGGVPLGPNTWVPLEPGQVLQVVSELFELRRATASEAGSPNERCLDALQAWIDAPSEAAVLALGAVDPRWVDAATKCALHAVLSVPASPGEFLERLVDRSRGQSIIAQALIPWATRPDQSPAPAATTPPPQLVRGAFPVRSPFPPTWPALASFVSERFGLRLQCSLGTRHPRCNSYLTWNAEQQRSEILDLVRGRPEDYLRLPNTGWSEVRHPSLAQVFAAGPLSDSPRGWFCFYLREALVDGDPPLAWRERASPDPARCAKAVAALCPALGEALPLLGDLCLNERVRFAPSGEAVFTGLALLEVEEGEREDQDPLPDLHRLANMAWLTPEQAAEGEVALELAGVYQLGLLLYLLLTGQPAFRARTSRVLLDILDNAPTPPSELGVTLPPALEAHVLQCLAKSPADRPSSLADLEVRLRAFAD
jgi:FHA domain